MLIKFSVFVPLRWEYLRDVCVRKDSQDNCICLLTLLLLLICWAFGNISKWLFLRFGISERAHNFHSRNFSSLGRNIILTNQRHALVRSDGLERCSVADCDARWINYPFSLSYSSRNNSNVSLRLALSSSSY